MSEDEFRPMPPAVIPPKGTRLGSLPAAPTWLWWVIGVVAVWLFFLGAMVVAMGAGRS